MTQIDYYAAQFVESFPTPMDPGVLYVSLTYSTAGHICPCGCGCEVVTKLSPPRYRLILDGEVSLSPSVAATGLPCNSHYFITRGQVKWHRKLDPMKVEKVRASDLRAVANHRVAVPRQRAGWWSRFWLRRKS